MSDDHEARETAFFTGAETPILYSREINLNLKCDFNLQYFPFDTQTCFISLKPGDKVNNFIKLVGDSMEFSGDRQLATFDVVKLELEAVDEGVMVKIFVKRQISQYLFGIYVPSLFIMIAAQVIAKY